MKLGSVRYLIGEGFKNVWVNRLMSIASVGVLVACMVIIGLAMLVSENINIAVGNLEKQNVVMVYMKDYNWALYGNSIDEEDASSDTEEGVKPDKNGIYDSDYVIHNEDEAMALRDEIMAIENVEDAEYISSEQGLATIKESMLEGQEEYFTFLDDEYGNPISAAVKVKMENMEFFDETIKEIEKLNGVDTIQSQSDLADTITAIKKGITMAGIWIIAILIVISLVIVSNTIRVTMYNRKLEISIMKAVGATDTFIRIPFVIEGILIGILSAGIAEGLLYFCYRVATETLIETLGVSEIIAYSDMAWYLFGIFVAIGIVAGAIGSFIIIGKYLKREGSEFSALG